MGTPELRAAVAAMTDEQRDNALVFLECNTEELAGLPDGCGIQAVVNVRNLLDYLPTVSFARRHPVGVLYNGELGVEVCGNLPESLLESFIQEFSLS